jgi:hypothetical protein
VHIPRHLEEIRSSALHDLIERKYSALLASQQEVSSQGRTDLELRGVVAASDQ